MFKITFPIGIFLAVICSIILSGCTTAPGGGSNSGGGPGGGIRTYAGSEPKGDYIVIEIDTANSKVRRINFTTGETNGWFDYTSLSTSQANGFSILKKATIMSNSGTNQFVIFAEYPSAACVYQMFIVTNSITYTEGNPVYVVYRQALAKSDFYGKAYNWMKFNINDNPTKSDMECGFASFDTSGQFGKMYGAGYSKKSATGTGGDITNCGFHNINNNNTVYVNDFSDNSEAVSLTMWTSNIGLWDYAISLTGTPSGTVILDFGTNTGGGSGIAIPQTTAVDNPGTWWTTVVGTYFTLIYEYDKYSNEMIINPMKIVVGTGGLVKVFGYTNHTGFDTPVFNQSMTIFSNATSNQSPVTNMTAAQLLNYFASNQNAASPVVTNAHLCEGAFLYAGPNQVLFTIFDPSGRFLGFTMFDDTGSGNYIIRFGFGIKDTGYNDSSF